MFKIFAISAVICVPSFAAANSPNAPDGSGAGEIETAAMCAMGRYSKLCLPRYASLKAERVHFRKGPGRDYPIAWTLTRENLPVRIIGEFGNWRRVELFDGERGWIHRALLSGRRHAVSREGLIALYSRRDAEAPPLAAVPEAAPMSILSCEIDWCELAIGGYRGWAPKRNLWGVGANEEI
ncbi:MAG: SH3 domain-containing protein [Pseudomonadota bacterium]